MKRYSLIGLLTVLVAVTVWAAIIEVPEAPARMTAVVVGGGGAVAGPSCSATATVDLDDNDDNWTVASSNNEAIAGQGSWAPATDKTICKVSFNINGVSGTAKTWYAIIFPMSGTSLGSPAAGCVSTGTSISAAGWAEFTGLDCDVLAASTYGVTISRSSTGATSADCVTDGLCDGSNYITYRVSTTTGAVVGNTMEWFLDDKTRAANRTANDTNVKIYYME